MLSSLPGIGKSTGSGSLSVSISATAEPPFAEIRHAAAARFAFEDFAGLPFGANKEHEAALRHHLGDVFMSAKNAADGFAQVNNMNQVAFAVDIRPHLRVPAAGAVPE